MVTPTLRPEREPCDLIQSDFVLDSGSLREDRADRTNTGEAISMLREASNGDSLLLVSLPPTKGHIRLALGVVAALVVVFFMMAPFARIQLPQLGAFYLVILTVTMVNDLITSALLFSQFFVVGRTALFALSISYVFTGLLTIPLMLVFPGGFSPTGLLGAGLQSAVLIVVSYRLGISLGLIAYALLRNADSTTGFSDRSPLLVVIGSVAVVVAIVCALTWVAVAKEPLLPIIFADTVHRNRGPAMLFAVVQLTLIALALALLWVRWRSVLDLWLMVVCVTEMLFQIMSGFIVNERFTLGWYGARCYAVIATMVVLLALLSETTTLYAKLARSVVRESRVRAARQMTADAVVASIAHEIRQPLSGMVSSANAGLHWLDRAAPDLNAAKTALNRIVTDGHRASAVIENIRVLFKQDAGAFTSIDVNALVRQVLATVDADLRTHRILVSAELREGLPLLLANRTQLEEVFLNLVINAIEAMHSVTDRARLLRITTEVLQEPPIVLVTIADAGTGIDSQDKERIFEPFFTTKSRGMGIGLFVCRAIVESHGGTLQASANNPYGTAFRVAVPSSHS